MADTEKNAVTPTKEQQLADLEQQLQDTTHQLEGKNRELEDINKELATTKELSGERYRNFQMANRQCERYEQAISQFQFRERDSAIKHENAIRAREIHIAQLDEMLARPSVVSNEQKKEIEDAMRADITREFNNHAQAIQDKGYKSGYDEGRKAGLGEGFNDGFKEGFNRAKQEGQVRLEAAIKNHQKWKEIHESVQKAHQRAQEELEAAKEGENKAKNQVESEKKEKEALQANVTALRQQGEKKDKEIEGLKQKLQEQAASIAQSSGYPSLSPQMNRALFPNGKDAVSPNSNNTSHFAVAAPRSNASRQESAIHSSYVSHNNSPRPSSTSSMVMKPQIYSPQAPRNSPQRSSPLLQMVSTPTMDSTPTMAPNPAFNSGAYKVDKLRRPSQTIDNAHLRGTSNPIAQHEAMRLAAQRLQTIHPSQQVTQNPYMNPDPPREQHRSPRIHDAQLSSNVNAAPHSLINNGAQSPNVSAQLHLSQNAGSNIISNMYPSLTFDDQGRPTNLLRPSFDQPQPRRSPELGHRTLPGKVNTAQQAMRMQQARAQKQNPNRPQKGFTNTMNINFDQMPQLSPSMNVNPMMQSNRPGFTQTQQNIDPQLYNTNNDIQQPYILPQDPQLQAYDTQVHLASQPRPTLPKLPAKVDTKKKLRGTTCVNCHFQWWNDWCDDNEPCENCITTGILCERPRCENFNRGTCERKTQGKCNRAHEEDGWEYVANFRKDLKRKGRKKDEHELPPKRRRVEGIE